MRRLKLNLLLALSLALAACGATDSKINGSPTANPANTTIPASITPYPSVTIPARTPPSPTVQTAGTSPTVQVRPSQPPPLPAINSSNAAGLAQIAVVDFAPWAMILAVAWSPDGQAIAVSAGQSVRLLEAGTLEESYQWKLGATTGSLAWSPDGQFLAAGSRDGQVRIWELSTGKLVQSIQAHKKGVNSVAFHPSGNLLVSGGNDAVARLWDIRSGERLAQMIGGTYAVPSLAFTRQGDNLAIVNGNVIRLRQVATGQFVQTIRAKEGIYSLAVNPDETLIASGGLTGAVEAWDSASGEARISYLDPSVSPTPQPVLIWSVAFSPDGSLLAAAGSDARIWVWETQTGELLATLPGHTKSVTSLSFSPDGRMLASGSLDGALRLWGIR